MGTQSYQELIGLILYLAGKDNHLLDDPSGLVPEELLDNEATEGTSPDNGEVCVFSRHE
jgi:hypothetical protein